MHLNIKEYKGSTKEIQTIRFSFLKSSNNPLKTLKTLNLILNIWKNKNN